MTKPKKILILLSYYYPYISGVSEYAKLLAESLTRHHIVTVLTGKHDNSLLEHEFINGVEVIRAPASIFLHKGYFSAALAYKFFKLVRTADVVNFHLPMLDAAWLTKMIPPHVPVIVTYQCDVQAAGGLLDRAAIACVNFSSRRALLKADRIVVLSNDYASESAVVDAFQAPVIEGFAPIKDQTSANTLLRPFNDVSPAIGFLGRFVAEKGIDVLIQAFKIVRIRRPGARLLLAGDYKNVAGGSIFSSLKEQIQSLGDSVELLGRISDTHLGDFYARLDLFVLPSINAYEAFGMVQVEAMFAGVPVVASNMRGVRVPVKLTGCGRLAPPGSPHGLARAIELSLDENVVMDRPAIRRAALNVFSNEAFTQRYLDIIAEVLDQR